RSLKEQVEETLRNLSLPSADYGAEFGLRRRASSRLHESLSNWYIDSNLSGHIVNHVARGHKRPDLHRYLFCAAFAALYGESPKSADFPQALWPDHRNFAT